MKKIILTILVLVMLALCTVGTATAKEDMLIYSARFGGVQYLAGNVMAELINANSDKYVATNLETSGAIENIKQDEGNDKVLVKTIRLVLSINYYSAINGQTPFNKKYEDYRVIFSYAASAGGPFVVSDPNIKSIQDLAGKKVGVGERGSAFINETRYILDDCFGIWDDVKKEYLGYAAAQDTFMDNLIDAVYVPGNITANGKFGPHPALQSMIVLKKNMRMLPLSVEDLNRGSDKNNWPRFPTVQLEVGAIAPNFPDEPQTCYIIQFVALVHKSMPEDMVYDLVKVCAENSDKFRETHVSLGIMSPEIMAWLPVKTEEEIHPGALKYFNENGIPLLINGAVPDVIK